MLTNQALREKTGKTLREFIVAGSEDFKYWVESLTRYRLEPFHLEWARSYLYNKRTCLVSFRGSGKTLVLGILLPLWLMFYNRDLVFINVSPVMSRQSTKIVSEIRHIIKDTEILNSMMPKDRGFSWTKTEINTSTGCKMVCAPYSSASKTFHAHYMLFDEAQEFKDLDVYYDTFMPMIQHHDGNVVVIGTPDSETDLLARCQLPNSGYMVKKYPLVDPVSGVTNWSKAFSDKRVEEIKKDIGMVAFARQYLLELRGGESQSIPTEAIIASMDTALSLENMGDRISEYFHGVDLATSPTGDWFAQCVIKRTKSKNLVLAYLERSRGKTPQSQAEAIAGVHNRFRPLAGFLDISQTGPAILNDLKATYGVNLMPYRFDPHSRNELFSNMASAFGYKDESGSIVGNRVIIPRNLNDPCTMTHTDLLMNELTALYPSKTKTGMFTYKTTSKHDDLAVAFSLAVQASIRMREAEVYIRVD